MVAPEGSITLKKTVKLLVPLPQDKALTGGSHRCTRLGNQRRATACQALSVVKTLPRTAVPKNSTRLPSGRVMVRAAERLQNRVEMLNASSANTMTQRPMKSLRRIGRKQTVSTHGGQEVCRTHGPSPGLKTEA